MRRIACLVLAAALLAPAACRKPKPSPAFLEARGAYTTLIAELGDDAYAEPQMQQIEDVLKTVPSDSADAQAAQDLLAKIASERKRIDDERAAREKALASALAPTPPDNSPRPTESPEPAAAAVDAGTPSEFATGMSLEDVRRVSQGCFSFSGPLQLRNADGTESPAEVYERMDSTVCNSRYARYSDRFLVFKENKLVGDFAKSSFINVKAPAAGGAAGAGGTAAPAPKPAPAPAPIVEPGGDKPPTPQPMPTSPGEQTGPAPAP